jgi:excisionase family DNA binding protein
MVSHTSNPISIRDDQWSQVFGLRRLIQKGGAKLVGADGLRVDIPEPVQNLLILMLQNLQDGNAVSIVSEQNEPLTTQRAADILWVSRPFLVRLAEHGEIPFHRVGSHRRLYLRDVLDYKFRRDAQTVKPTARAEGNADTQKKD